MVRSVQPGNVHETLNRHLQATGYALVLDLVKSHGSFVCDSLSGKEYLDFASFYASNPLGFNHPGMLDAEIQSRLLRAATVKIANPNFYTEYLAEFVDTLSRTAAPPELPHYFFIEGGALAVENGMKAAFDWKIRKNLAQGRGEKGTQILHFQHAFHGRSGYTLSTTNTDPAKTLHFPKFSWPRIPSPALHFPVTAANLADVTLREQQALAAIETAFEHNHNDIAAILIEPIQGEGGDRHFRPEFLKALRRIADEREALLIFDEVQTGVGITGAWWAFQRIGVQPDIVCFAKKMQVGGILASKRLDEVDNVFSVKSRISSTWGGNLVDMVRATHILEIIDTEGLLAHARVQGELLLGGVQKLEAHYPHLISNARGLGLMCAFDLPSAEMRNRFVAQCFDEQLLILACGDTSIRFRPILCVKPEDIQEALRRMSKVLKVLCC